MRENHIKYRILAEVREEHDNLLNQDVIYNDYVSKKSMIEMAEGISSLGYDCEFIGGMTKLTELCNNKPDVSNTIFINYNYGYPSQFKRGQSPILLEMNHAKYTGSDPFVSLLVNDKYCTKKIVSKNCYKTPMSLLILTNDDTRFINEENINVPLVVKPNSEGSSLGITNDSLCQTYGQAIAQCLKLLEVFPSVIVEEYVPGYELTVWLIGNKDDFELICPLLVSVNEIYYFESKIITIHDKSQHNRTYSSPHNYFSQKTVDELINISKRIFEELGMRDYARLDFRINGSDIFFIEANALPIFSKSSEIGEICKLYNKTYQEICKRLVSTITKRLMPEAY